MNPEIGIRRRNSIPVHINNSEYLNSIANQIIHHDAYKLFYLLMAILSFICLLKSLLQTCPSSWFYILEFIIIVTMTVETTLRIVAVQSTFWDSPYNILDVSVIALCIICYALMLDHNCGDNESNTEVLAEEVLLIIRNVIQLTRMANMVQKNHSQLSHSARNIDLDSVQGVSAQLIPSNADDYSVNFDDEY
ncbi:hypothetical protein BC833DRAFT_579475 [Globomyces pollinis-pini]|nr:hypothetical protein BC833DRAFT_579475 [Globomyces pollinis-pini]